MEVFIVSLASQREKNILIVELISVAKELHTIWLSWSPGFAYSRVLLLFIFKWAWPFISALYYFVVLFLSLWQQLHLRPKRGVGQQKLGPKAKRWDWDPSPCLSGLSLSTALFHQHFSLFISFKLSLSLPKISLHPSSLSLSQWSLPLSRFLQHSRPQTRRYPHCQINRPPMFEIFGLSYDLWKRLSSAFLIIALFFFLFFQSFSSITLALLNKLLVFQWIWSRLCSSGGLFMRFLSSAHPFQQLHSQNHSRPFWAKSLGSMASQSGHLCHRPNGPAASSSSNAAPCSSTSQVAAVTVPQQVRAHLSINENALESFGANFTPQIDCLMIASSSLLSLNRESIDSPPFPAITLQLTYHIISIITQLLSASVHQRQRRFAQANHSPTSTCRWLWKQRAAPRWLEISHFGRGEIEAGLPKHKLYSSWRSWRSNEKQQAGAVESGSRAETQALSTGFPFPLPVSPIHTRRPIHHLLL